MVSDVSINPQVMSTVVSRPAPAQESVVEEKPAVAEAPVAKKQVETSEHMTQSMMWKHETLQASYDYDSDLHQIIIKLQRADNGEIVQQFPPEQVLQIISHVLEAFDNEANASQVDVKG